MRALAARQDVSAGFWIGEKEGEIEGEIVGEIEGEVVGDMDGDVVGDWDGAIVGEREGEIEGEAVGDEALNALLTLQPTLGSPQDESHHRGDDGHPRRLCL